MSSEAEKDTYRTVHVLFRSCDRQSHATCPVEYKDDEMEMIAYCTCDCHTDAE
jgi:hypothetical protein